MVISLAGWSSLRISESISSSQAPRVLHSQAGSNTSVYTSPFCSFRSTLTGSHRQVDYFSITKPALTTIPLGLMCSGFAKWQEVAVKVSFLPLEVVQFLGNLIGWQPYDKHVARPNFGPQNKGHWKYKCRYPELLLFGGRKYVSQKSRLRNKGLASISQGDWGLPMEFGEISTGMLYAQRKQLIVNRGQCPPWNNQNDWRLGHPSGRTLQQAFLSSSL